MSRRATKSRPASPKPPAPARARPYFPAWLIAVLLGLAAIALYWPTMRHDFVNYDDDVQVTSNIHVQNGLTLENLKWAFCKPLNANWYPLTVLSHMADCQFYGLNPWGHHLTSVLLHAINTALVFLLLCGLTGAAWRSALAALLFAVHPLHVESVAWVAERKDVLSAFFGLLALIFYGRYVRQLKAKNTRWKISYWLAFAFFACGLMSKPMLVTWPFVLLLLDYWPMRRFEGRGERAEGKSEKTAAIHLSPLTSHFPPLRQLLLEKIPFLALTLLICLVTFLVQKQGGALTMDENLSLGVRGGNALISYCRYLSKLFWPVDLAVFYPHPGHWPPVEVLLAAMLLLGITVLFVANQRRHPWLLMGWLWYVGTLLPVIQLVQTGVHAMADRYTYLPALGIEIVVIWGAYELARRSRQLVIALSVAGLMAVALCMILTRQQLRYWQDSETIFRHALAVTENNYIAHDDLGDALATQGRINEAITQFQDAIRVKPDFADAHYNLGVFLSQKGRTDEAASQFQEAVRLNPDDAESHLDLGAIYGTKGRMDAAISEFQAAIHADPDNAEAHYNLGLALNGKDRIEEAISEYREAIRLQPDYPNAFNNLGTALSRRGRIDEAISCYQEALRLQPDYPAARENLTRVLEIKKASPAPEPEPSQK